MFQPPNYYPSLLNDLWFPCQALAWKHAGPPNDKHTHCVINDRRFGNDKLANPRKARRASTGGSDPIITVCLGATEFHRKRLLCKAPISTMPFHYYSLAFTWWLSCSFQTFQFLKQSWSYCLYRVKLFGLQSSPLEQTKMTSVQKRGISWLRERWTYEEKKKEMGNSRTTACFPFSIQLTYPIIKLGPGSGESPRHAEDIDRPATDLCFVSQSKHVRTLFALARGRRCGAPSM